MEALNSFLQIITENSIAVPAWAPLVLLLVVAICLLTNTHHIGMLFTYLITIYISWSFVAMNSSQVGMIIFVTLAIGMLILALLQLHHMNS